MAPSGNQNANMNMNPSPAMNSYAQRSQQQQQQAYMQTPPQYNQQPQQQQQPTMQYHQQQHPPPGSMQSVASQPMPQPQNQMQHAYQPQQQQPGVQYAQSMDQQSVISQPQQQAFAGAPPQVVGGSYSSRSAQAYATIGTPPPQTVHQQQQQQQMLPAGSVVQQQQVPQAPKMGKYDDTPAVQAQQNRVLTDCTRKVQEHAYYMKQAMDKNELSMVLDRASHMVGELGDTSSGLLTPKNYYELHMRALDDMPNLEEYFLSLTSAESSKYTMKDLYNYVQYCPRVLPRLYLQISAGSALIRSKEGTPKEVLTDLIEAVKCVQNPLRGLFLRHFLLQATRDKLPDGDNVEDAYEFVLANFIEMNRLWVRIQHLPGDGKSKEQRKRREKERNELRILVGTNLVRLSQLEAVTSKIYGEVILPKILGQITACGDPLAQAYLIDCIIQVFPDEYHIETLPILLAVCPKLRDKVNIRTIIQSLMDRLANYYADEELLDEADTNEVKKNVARESFPMFEDCVQNVFHSRGPKLVSREVIRLQTALLTFSLKCHPGNMEQISRCLGVCIEYIRQAANTTAIANQTPLLEDSEIKLDQASVTELGKMLSIPLDSLALKVLELSHYADLLQFLPWESRRDVGMTMLRAIDTSGGAPTNVKELEELFSIILPVLRDPYSEMSYGQNPGERSQEMLEENSLVSKLVHLLDHDNVDVTYEMLMVARSHLSEAGLARTGAILVPVVFSALRLGSKVALESTKPKDANGEKVATESEEQKYDDAEAKPDGEESAKATDDVEKSEEGAKATHDEDTPKSEEGAKVTGDEENGAITPDDDKDGIEVEEDLMVQENNVPSKEVEKFQSTLR
jgi:vacuolar protein sorting-associated protein 35